MNALLPKNDTKHTKHSKTHLTKRNILLNSKDAKFCIRFRSILKRICEGGKVEILAFKINISIIIE